MTATQQTARPEITFKAEETLLKLRKGAAASLNAKRLEEIFEVMPGWKIEKIKSFRQCTGRKALKDSGLPGIYSGAWDEHGEKNGLVQYAAAEAGSVEQWITEKVWEEYKHKFARLQDDFLPALQKLAEEPVAPKAKSYIRNVQSAMVPDRYQPETRQMLQVTFEFYLMVSGFRITAPDGQTFEVFGDLWKDGAVGAKTFVDFYNWAIEETDFLDTVLDLLGMEAVEKKHDPRTPYTPPPAASKATHFVFGILKDLTENVRDEQKARMVEWMTASVEAFAAFSAANPEEAKKKFAERLGGLVRVWNRKENSLVADWKTVIEEIAEREVNAMQNMFVYKNTRKLAPIIDGKGTDLTSIEVLRLNVRQGIIEAELAVTFDDGSRFDVKQSTVSSYATNLWGSVTYFYRFPTTFHDAFLADGTRIKNVDEEAMNTIFAKGA